MDWADRQKPARRRTSMARRPSAIVEKRPGAGHAGDRAAARKARASSAASRWRRAARAIRSSFTTRSIGARARSSLKAAFPLTVEQPAGGLRRQSRRGHARQQRSRTSTRCPQHEWFDLTDKDGSYGVGVLNDCKFGSDKPDDHTVRLTLLYTPGTRGGYQDQGTQDFGRHDIAYAVAGHPGGWQAGRHRGARAPAQPAVARLHAASGASRRPGPLAFAWPRWTIRRWKSSRSRKRRTATKPSCACANSAARSTDGPPQVRRAHRGRARDRRTGTPAPERACRRPRRRVCSRCRCPPFGLRAFALKLGAPRARVEPSDRPRRSRCPSTRTWSARGPTARTAPSMPMAAPFPPRCCPGRSSARAFPSSSDPPPTARKTRWPATARPWRLPGGDYDHVVAARGLRLWRQVRHLPVRRPPTPASGQRTHALDVQDWSGYLGQWDNRLWKGARARADLRLE